MNPRYEVSLRVGDSSNKLKCRARQARQETTGFSETERTESLRTPGSETCRQRKDDRGYEAIEIITSKICFASSCSIYCRGFQNKNMEFANGDGETRFFVVFFSCFLFFVLWRKRRVDYVHRVYIEDTCVSVLLNTSVLQ